MSLTWDITECADQKWINDNWDIARDAIFTTMSVGIGHITRENCAEFYARNVIWCKVHGFPSDLLPEHVEKLIGLRTNVFPEDTTAKWMSRLTKELRRQVVQQRDVYNDSNAELA